MDINKNWIIAEIGSVHDGSFGNAIKLIEAAAAAGADCVKFQTHLAEAETLADAPNPSYFKAEPRISYFKRTGFTLGQWKELKAKADELKVTFLSSPFSIEAVDLLEEVGISAYKIPSGEINNIPLLERVGKTKKPVLLSSGMSSWEELEKSVAVVKKCGNPLVVMQCTSAYPCPPNRVGLNILDQIRKSFPFAKIGYSDHTLSYSAPIAAAALGATIIEKHFTFSKLMYGSDAKHSMEPIEFKILCENLRETWAIMSSPVEKTITDDLKQMKNIFEKSVVSMAKLAKDHVITEADLAFKKPGDGIPAGSYLSLVGKKLKCDVGPDHKFSWSDFH